MAETVERTQPGAGLLTEKENNKTNGIAVKAAPSHRNGGVNGEPGPAVSTIERPNYPSASGSTPPTSSPRDVSPDRLTPFSTSSRTNSALKKPYVPGPNLVRSATTEPSLGGRELGDSDTALQGTGTPTAGRKSVQFSRDTEEIGSQNNGQVTPNDGSEQEKPHSLYARLRALAIPQGYSFSHTRSPSGLSTSARSADGKDLDSQFVVPGRNEIGLAATLEEDSGAEADADADESSAAENYTSRATPRKRRRKPQRFDDIETAPSSPHSPIRTGFASAPMNSDAERPRVLARRATDTDMVGGPQGMSEDEGRKQLSKDTSWKPRHPLRGLSYGGSQRRTGDTTPEGSQRRPLTLLSFANIGSSREGASSAEQTPKTPSRRKLLAERSSTLGAAKWSQLKNSIRTLGQRKKKMPTPENLRSAALLAELAAGAPAALMLASMFQRDERNQRRVPVLLEQLKVQVVDSEVDHNRFRDDKPLKESDEDRVLRHLIFKIECEYGNGANRMKWVIKRSLGDFSRLHIKYKTAYNAGRLRLRSDGRKKLPHFPLDVFPYLKSLRLFADEHDEDGEADGGDETEPGTATDTERPTPQSQTRPAITPNRRKSSIAGLPDPTTPAGTRREAFAERQRKSLERYLREMIQFLLFRPESNRLCRFLEISALGMRLAAEGSEHGKEGALLIRSAKGIDFRALNAGEFKKRHSPKWFLVRHSYVVCVDSAEQMHIYDVFLFDSDFRIQPRRVRTTEQRSAKELANLAKESAKHPQHHRLKLVNSERKLKLLSDNERQLQQFEDSIRELVAASPWAKVNRFNSFAPVRPNCFAQWLVDGRDHMWVVSRALNQAKDVIYIHDWWLSPELYMRRPPAISQKWRLDRLLKRKAQEGVKIFVIVYRNIDAAVPIDSQYTKFSLLDLHPNIFVQRSPNQFRQNTFFWAHHEKICIVDHTVAFVGGIDLCFGRWDTPQHSLIDDKATGFEPSEEPKDADHCQLWPGKDYSNPRIQDFYALNKPYEEMYDRQRVARMPWHDISMQVVGQPARDLTRHFVQRWNYILRQRKPTRPTPFLLPPPDFNPADLEALGLDGTCEVQICRSAGPWSLGTPDKTEHSIMSAYIKMIEESEHFVYIENQFFISSCETESTVVHNKIGDALVERITRASKNDEAWKAVVVIPLIPGFQNTVEEEGGTSVRLIMQYQYRSICRGESSIFGRLKAVGIDPEDYIQFYALRQWGRIGPRKTLVTEQLYIHAKCMIVDDRVAVIGSANINERSMLGNRDSECAAVVRDTDMVWSKMNGKPYKVGRFPHTLRMRLMREHLGLDVDQIMEEAQVMEADHHKAHSLGKSVRSQSPDDTFYSPSSEADDVLGPLDGHGTESHEDVIQRIEEFRSFNHDVDWEQEGNPNLKSKRAGVTQDPRVTGDPHHKDDVEGFGHDRMAAIAAVGLGDGRDTTIIKGNKEVLVSDLDPEGRATLTEPRKRGEQPRLTSYVAKMETPNPPLPPKPGLERMSTHQLGLPMISQLPPLPTSDDSDIGGPALAKVTSKDSVRGHHPLVNELRRPLIDRDCMTDPIHDAFFFDTWHTVAENNTKIYRSVFRCMPDNQVRNWEDYHQYLAYEQRFNQLQGNDLPPEQKVTDPSRGGEVSSGPPGVGARYPVAELKAVAHVPSDIEKRTHELKGKLRNALGEKSKEQKTDPDKEKLRIWAAEANRVQAEKEGKPSPHRQETLTAEKAGLQTVPEGQAMTDEGSATGEDDEATTDPPNSSTGSTAVEKEKPTVNGTSPTATGAFVGYSEAVNQNATQVTGSGGGSGRRRRRATTRSSRGNFSASDDLLSIEEAEELLACVQGHLVVWPYDWLEKVEAGSNWLFPFDQISPIEIYTWHDGDDIRWGDDGSTSQEASQEHAKGQVGLLYMQVSGLHAGIPLGELAHPFPASVSDQPPAINRARRVKCDEQKPGCRRCLRAGRTCGGYSPEAARGPASQQQQQPASITTYSIPFKVPGSQADRQLLHYYCCQAAWNLSSGTDPTLWTELILQRASHQPVIRNALVALSALHKDYLCGELGGTADSYGTTQTRYEDSYTSPAPVADVKTMAMVGRCHRQLRNYLSRTDASPDVALVCSLIFYTFESLLGESQRAIWHLDQGLILLRKCQLDKSLASHSDHHDPLIPRLSTLLHRLDLQASCFDDRRAPLLRLATDAETKGHVDLVPDAFVDLAHAEAVLAKIQNWALHHLVNDVHFRGAAVQDLPSESFVERLVLAAQLQKFEDVLDRFACYESSISNTTTATHHRRGDRDDDQRRQRTQRILLIRINLHTFTYLVRENIPLLTAQAYETANKVMASLPRYNSRRPLPQIVPPRRNTEADLERALAGIDAFLSQTGPACTAPSANPARTYTLSTHLIGALYFLSLKTTNKQVLEKATALFSHPQLRHARDGLWDARTAAFLVDNFVRVRRNGNVTMGCDASDILMHVAEQDVGVNMAELQRIFEMSETSGLPMMQSKKFTLVLQKGAVVRKQKQTGQSSDEPGVSPRSYYPSTSTSTSPSSSTAGMAEGHLHGSEDQQTAGASYELSPDHLAPMPVPPRWTPSKNTPSRAQGMSRLTTTTTTTTTASTTTTTTPAGNATTIIRSLHYHRPSDHVRLCTLPFNPTSRSWTQGRA